MGHPLEESQINMLTLVALAFVAAVSADSVRYQVSTTPISYEKDLQSFNAGAARLVTLNLEEEKCDAPTIEQPCGWGLHRTVYAPVDGKTYMSGGQRNAFGLNKADNMGGFWSNAELATEDLPGDLITLEKDLRVEYGVAPLRQKSAKKLVNGIHTGSSPSYVAGNVDLNAGANVGACFRLFDSEPAARPNSFDLVATGEYATGQPEGAEGNVVLDSGAKVLSAKCRPPMSPRSTPRTTSRRPSSRVTPTCAPHKLCWAPAPNSVWTVSSNASRSQSLAPKALRSPTTKKALPVSCKMPTWPSAAPPSSRWSTTRPTTACTKRASLTVMCASSARSPTPRPPPAATPARAPPSKTTLTKRKTSFWLEGFA